MKFFKALGRLLKAKDAEASEAIEKGNETAFAKQDLEKMEDEYKLAVGNVAKIKSKVIGFERDTKEKKAEIKKRTADAEALIAANKESLAQQHCAKIEGIQQEVDAISLALQQQKNLLTQQESNQSELKAAVNEAKTQIKLMQTMSDVAKSNESLSVVSTESSKSALSSFKDRKAKLQARFDESQALMEATSAGSDKTLEQETADALGKSGAGSDMLAKLKEKKMSKSV